MKERLLTGWNLNRVVYLVMGIIVIIQAVMMREWLGIFAGGYLASMGLFAMGCASGNCYGSTCVSKPLQNISEPTHVEEINTK